MTTAFVRDGQRAQQTREPVPFLDLTRLHQPLADELDAAWRDVHRNSAFVGGAHVEGFEKAWAAFCGVDHAVGTANGTDALQLTLRALGVSRGDEVILPANTFAATAEAVVLAGARPKLVDVDPDTLLVTADHIAAALTPRTAAVIVVHLYGQVAEMDGIRQVTDRAGIALIEDAAQAHGARYRGRAAGSFGVAGCFSFYPGKNLGAFGDAGSVVTNDPVLADRLRSMTNHGRATDSKYQHPRLGTNSRLDGLQAAVLNVKLPRLEDWNASRRQAAARFRDRLQGHAVQFVAERPERESVHHLNVVRVSDRDRVRAHLGSQGIATGIHYPVPIHEMPPFAAGADKPLPATEQAAQEILTLPLFPKMTDDEIDRCCTAVVEALEGS